MLDVLRTVNSKGSYQGETKCNRITSKNSDSLFNTHSTTVDFKNFRENEVE